MTGAVKPRGLPDPVRFGLVEFDLIAAYAHATIPYPLRVPASGLLQDERDQLFATAAATLRQRALADDDGPIGLGRTIAAALARPVGTVDLVVTGHGAPMGIVAIIHRGSAVVCRQRLSETGTEDVEVDRVPVDLLVDALVELVPPRPGARSMPIRVPAAAVRAAAKVPRPGGGMTSPLFGIADRYGCSVDNLAAAVDLGRATLSTGQLGAMSMATGKSLRIDTQVSWVDVSAGRLRVALDPAGGHDHGWLSINPFHANDLRAAVAGLVGAVRGRGR